MKLLVTGARGFVGRHCMPLLIDPGIEIHATASSISVPYGGRNNINWHQIDLLDSKQVQALVAEVRPTHLLHLAWYTEHGLYWTDPVNNRWVTSSLELVKSFSCNGGKRAVVVGSCAEYKWNGSICEEGALAKPATIYGQSKNKLHMKLSSLASSSGLSFAWGRLFFIFGPYEDPRRLIPSVINSLGSGQPALCGSGDLIRDFLYVEDAAAALVTLLHSNFEGVVNIASGDPVSIGNIVYMIAEQMSARNLVRLGSLTPRPGDPLRLVGDSTRLREIVGFTPKFSLDESLAVTIGWWKDRGFTPIDARA